MKTITKKIRVHSLFVLLTFLLVHMSVFAGTSRIYTVDISILNEEETAAILSLQGLANREKPQILVLPKDKGGFSGGGYKFQDTNMQRDGLAALSQETLDKYASLEDVWEEYYTQTYDYTFESIGFEEAFNTFSSLYKGCIKYEGINAAAGIAIATTVCGVSDAIPITQSLLNKYPVFRNCTIIKDLTAFNFKNRKEAHRWAIDKYLDQTSKDYAYSYWQHERNLYTIDYAVAHKTFAFLLSFASAKNPQGGTYDQEEADMLDEIFAHLNPGSIILGWGESEEYIIQARCGEGGHALICTNVSPNLSFHAAIPTNIKSLKQKRQLDENSVTVENKIYITFSINEGDTYKSIGNLMMDGAWLHEKRGQIAFNWPTNPKILHMLPGLAQYYYNSMTDNDYFTVPTSGIGYFDATHSTEEARSLYAAKSKEVAEYADLHYIDVWWNGFQGNDKWLQSMGMKGYTSWTDKQQVWYFSAIPRIESELYYDLYYPPTRRKAANMDTYIKSQTESITDRPWFVHVYACDPTFAAEVMNNLPADRFKAVCMDEFFALAIKAKNKVQGRKIMKNPELMQQLIDDVDNSSFIEEFVTPSKWTVHDATYEIKDGEMIITATGTNYFSLLYRDGNRFKINKYPILAAKINQFPSSDNNNISWLIKLNDGNGDIVLNGKPEYQLKNYPNVYAWDIKALSNWDGTKETNLQFVIESTNGEANDLKDIQMKYDWIKTYESMNALLSDLDNQTGIINNQASDSDIKYTISQGILKVTKYSNIIENLAIYDTRGSKMKQSTKQNDIDINGLIHGIYILKINNLHSIKISI